MTTEAPVTTPAAVAMADPRYRTYDGSDNGGRDTGKVGRPLLDLGMPRVDFDPHRQPTPREISNAVCRQRHRLTRLDPHNRSEFMWAWGQFLDHELDLIPATGSEHPMPLPANDPVPEFGGTSIAFSRSVPSLANDHTAYVDAGNVYGASADRAEALRDGARLRVSSGPDGSLMPKNDRELFNVPPPAKDLSPDAAGQHRQRFFLAGDIRANEHCVLICMHTLFVREHNRLCNEIELRHPEYTEEEVYQQARRMIAGFMQVITYEEFLPALLGPGAIPPYTGYKPGADPGISNIFAAACYRIGHSMVRESVRLTVANRELRLPDVFFAPEFVVRLGVRAFLEPLAERRMAAIDTSIAEDLRSNLFRSGNDSILDLAALNIQRGRDHGLPDYNTCREAFGLEPQPDFLALTGDAALAWDLQSVYGDSMDGLDPWVGALAEKQYGPYGVGELMHVALVDQFTRSRDGDFYWYEHDPYLAESDRETIRNTRLSTILRRNVPGLYIADDVFHVPDHKLT